MNIKNFKRNVDSYIDEIKEEFNTNLNNVTKIKKIMKKNKGYITTKEMDNAKIGRDYLKKMILTNEIVNVERGIYIDSNIFEDAYYTFQLRYPNTVFSHFTALSFYGMTEQISYNYDVTTKNNKYSNGFKKHNIFYVSDDFYDLGVETVIDNYGFKIKTYNIERSICDIIRSKKRLDIEQVKKTVKLYMNSKHKNILKLTEYSKKMNIHDEVIRFVSFYEE